MGHWVNLGSVIDVLKSLFVTSLQSHHSDFDSSFFHLGLAVNVLTHWGRVTHICIDNLTIIGSDNGLSPGRRQAIIWTNAGILLIGPLGQTSLKL